MKQILGSLAALMLTCSAALAVQPTPTPIVAPETGENSQFSDEVFNMARMKAGQCTATVSVSGSAGSATCNGATGILSLTTATAGASGATPSVLTITNSKVQAGDSVQCTTDQTGITAGAVITCSVAVTANTLTISILDASVTAMTSSSMKVMFAVFTKGNLN
jgi:hypothetical protein